MELPVEDGRKVLAKSVLIPVLLPREVRLYLFFWTCGPLVERTGEGNLLSERTGSKSGNLSKTFYPQMPDEASRGHDHSILRIV